MNLRDAIDNYYLSCRSSKLQDQTMAAYRYALENFYQLTGNIDVTALTPEHIEAFIIHEGDRTIEGHQLSTASVGKFFAVVRTFTRWLYKRRYVHDQLTDLVKSPRQDKTLPDAMTEAQTKQLLNYMNEQEPFRNRLIFEFFVDTGMRLNEVSNMDVDDLNMESGVIRVRMGKGRKDAFIPLGNKLALDLHTYITRYRKPASSNEKALFVNRFGRRLEREGLAILVRRIMARAGVSGKQGPHKLRHTFATNFLRGGGNLEALRRILRHTSIKTTQIYTNLDIEDVKEQHQRSSLLDRIG